jgi:hypothetical protein
VYWLGGDHALLASALSPQNLFNFSELYYEGEVEGITIGDRKDEVREKLVRKTNVNISVAPNYYRSVSDTFRHFKSKTPNEPLSGTDWPYLVSENLWSIELGEISNLVILFFCDDRLTKIERIYINIEGL